MNKIEATLENMFNKYGCIEPEKYKADNQMKECVLTIQEKTYKFLSDYSKLELYNTDGKTIKVPILSWKNERKYIEMKNMINDGTVGEPVGMRIKYIFSNEDEVKNNIIKKINLIEWLFDDKIESVFSSSNRKEYFNIIISTKKGIKISVEIGKARSKEDIQLHEIITKKGVINDMPVDTQVNHYPIYVYDETSCKIYNDVDFELYGLEYSQVMKVRFIFNYFNGNIRSEDLCNELKLNNKVMEAIFKSAEQGCKINIQ